MKIVIDTNVIASSIYFGGKPANLISLLMHDKIQAYVSEAIIDEYCVTVNDLRERYFAKPNSTSINDIISQCKLISPKKAIKICRDPDDDKFIECAVEGKCIYVVSGDKDLLSIGSYDDIQIVTVAEFLEKYV